MQQTSLTPLYMTEISSKVVEAEEQLVEYLHSFDGKTSFPRITCCNSSRSLYCGKCCHLLVPDDVLPDSISLRKEIRNRGGDDCEIISPDIAEKRQRPLKLPFNLHIVLDDRRYSATGLHAVALLGNGDGVTENDLGAVKLIDIANGDDVPEYHSIDQTTRAPPEEDNSSIDVIEQSETVFLLFPVPGESIAIEEVADQIDTLVVLDCKWTKSSLCRKNTKLSNLKKVHLSNPPTNSYYWRWHNAGPGCVSTIEAIYYAAMEVSVQEYLHMITSNDKSTNAVKDHLIDQSNLVHLLWLFGHQRAATIQAASRDGKPAPGSDEGKELARSLRKQTGEYAWRSERNKEVGKILKAECRILRQARRERQDLG